VRQVSDSIPKELAPRVDAAVAWFNASAESEGETFQATGILDADDALQGSDELQLVLCGGDRCEQHSFLVTDSAGTWFVEHADRSWGEFGEARQADLDPPPGARLHWLDKSLLQHEFVLLLFYRGFW